MANDYPVTQLFLLAPVLNRSENTTVATAHVLAIKISNVFGRLYYVIGSQFKIPDKRSILNLLFRVHVRIPLYEQNAISPYLKMKKPSLSRCFKLSLANSYELPA
jgi:hypothetical protein